MGFVDASDIGETGGSSYGSKCSTRTILLAFKGKKNQGRQTLNFSCCLEEEKGGQKGEKLHWRSETWAQEATRQGGRLWGKSKEAQNARVQGL